jgi:hypothetical protein
MLTTVNFDHQVRGWAIKIDDVRTYRLLPVKLPAVDLLAAQTVPKFLFGIGHISAQLAGIGFQAFVVG